MGASLALSFGLTFLGIGNHKAELISLFFFLAYLGCFAVALELYFG